MPSLNSSHVPADIWLEVGQFIPAVQIPTLLDVNRTFFAMALNSKYETVVMGELTPRTTEYLQLVRLNGKRVRHLVLQLDLMKHSSIDFVETLASLTNVSRCSIHWTGRENLPKDVVYAIRDSLGPTLASLKVLASTRGIGEVISLMGNLPCLTELTLELMGEGGSKQLLELASCMNSMRLLRSLDVSVKPASSTFDIGPLFKGLGAFPFLRHVRLDACLTTACGVESPFMRFMSDHAEVNRVELGLQTESSLGPWLVRTMHYTDVLRNLDHLAMAAPSSSARLGLAISCIMRSLQTMTSLALTGDPLTYDEMVCLVEVLACRRKITSLKVHVKALTPELVELLAVSLPQVRRLSIGTEYVLPREGAPVAESEYPGNPIMRSKQIAGFAVDLHQRAFNNWQLEDLDIFTLGVAGGPAASAEGTMTVKRAIGAAVKTGTVCVDLSVPVCVY